MNLVIPETVRQELKFVANDYHFHSLLHWLHLHDFAFVRHHSDRWINNIYFDTSDYETFSDNLSGASSRLKVRYRWYGNILVPGKGTLEIKCKRNCFNWKLGYSVGNDDERFDETLKTFHDQMCDELPLDGKKWVQHYSIPILLNQYQRKYFVSNDQRLRVTLDTHLSVWDQRYKPLLNRTNKANLPKVMVLEVKFDRRDKDLASQFLHGLPLRVSRHSKYVTGLLAIRSH